MNNKKVARVSATPGKTRLLNFFLINQRLLFRRRPRLRLRRRPIIEIEQRSPRCSKEYFAITVRPAAASSFSTSGGLPSKDDMTMYVVLQATTGLPVDGRPHQMPTSVSNNVTRRQIKAIKAVREARRRRDEESLRRSPPRPRKTSTSVWRRI
ncbi:MAG: hypothetical protein MZU97_11250 [Bacillus subtilis]|nr:hypothetical protein [Bacillus subtilis]